jgi:hypothetical protein
VRTAMAPGLSVVRTLEGGQSKVVIRLGLSTAFEPGHEFLEAKLLEPNGDGL